MAQERSFREYALGFGVVDQPAESLGSGVKIRQERSHVVLCGGSHAVGSRRVGQAGIGLGIGGLLQIEHHDVQVVVEFFRPPWVVSQVRGVLPGIVSDHVHGLRMLQRVSRSAHDRYRAAARRVRP